MSLFTQEQLAKLVEDTLPADAKPGEKVIVGTVDATGAKAIISFNKDVHGANWQFQWATAYQWHGDAQTGGKVIIRW